MTCLSDSSDNIDVCAVLLAGACLHHSTQLLLVLRRLQRQYHAFHTPIPTGASHTAANTVHA